MLMDNLGQFFIYQGFNENCGWMHTSTNVDVADMYAEKIVTKNDKLFYEYNLELLPVIEKSITVKYPKRKINSESI
jgi:acyl-homoserine lactone acylase PvdQ